MNQAIRSSWVVAVALFALILGSVTYVQFFAVDTLKADSLNNRVILQNYCNERGPILVGGQAISQSVPTGDSCKFVRQYTDGPIYAGLTGFFSRDYGSSGLENVMNDVLVGESPDQFFDRIGQILSGAQPKGSSVELTVDPAIQKMAYDMIPDGVQGSIVVMNPKTGAIIAMVSKPSYDPNLLSSHNFAQVTQSYQQLVNVPQINMFGSRAYRDTYYPGSVFKIIDTAAALASGKYNKDSVLPNPAVLNFPGTTVGLPNYVSGGCAARSQANFAFALAQSCNTPFASIAADLGQQAITDQATKFGFNDPNLKIPSPVEPSVFPNKTNSTLDPASLARSAIGQQDVRATPLEIAMMTAAIANGGTQMKPDLIQAVRTPDLKPIAKYDFKPEVLRQSTTPEIAQQITQWMQGVVDNGIGKAAAVPGIPVAGKTGTAESDPSIPDSVKNSWFTGFAPANDPQVVVSIVVQGTNIFESNQLTSPNASKLFEAVLNK